MPDKEKQQQEPWHESVVPPARWPMEPKVFHMRRGYIPHIAAIAGALVSTVFLTAAYLPTAFVAGPSAPWTFIVHRPFETAGKQLEDAAVKGIPRYGISMFKICRLSMLQEDLQMLKTDDTACVTAHWVFSGDLKGIDKGEGLALSDAMSNWFPKLSHVILIMIILNIVHFAFLIFSWKRPLHMVMWQWEQYPFKEEKIRGSVVRRREHGDVSHWLKSEWRDQHHRVPQAWYNRLRSLNPLVYPIPAMWFFCLVVLAPVLLAAQTSKVDGKQDLTIEAGMGAWLLMAAIFAQPLAMLVPWLFGLKVHVCGGQKKKHNTGCFSAYNGKHSGGYYADCSRCRTV